MPTRMNVLFPDQLIEQMRSLVPEGRRSEFVVEATRERLLREQQKRALELGAGLWNEPEQAGLQRGEDVRRYLEELREPDAERAARLEADP